MIRIRETGKYDRMYQELIDENHAIREQTIHTVLLFRKNPNDTRLGNHPLHKRMEDKWAFSITDDIRVIYKWIGKNTVRFLAIGVHGRVYRK